MLMIPTLPARRRRLSVPSGSMQKTRLQYPHPAGAGNSERPFARPQRRFRHHYEVNAPDLRLRFHAGVSSRTRSTESSSARFGFEADTGRILHLRPVVRADLRRSCDAIRSPLPFRLFQPSGSKRSTGFTTTSSPHLTPDCLSLPATRSFDFRLGSTLETRLRPARLIVP